MISHTRYLPGWLTDGFRIDSQCFPAGILKTMCSSVRCHTVIGLDSQSMPLKITSPSGSMRTW